MKTLKTKDFVLVKGCIVYFVVVSKIIHAMNG